MKKTVITESDEQMIGNRFRTLESAVEYELPEEYYETKKERKAGKAIYYVLSAAAVLAVTLGVWYAAEYAKRYTPPTPASADTTSETHAESVPSDTEYTQVEIPETDPVKSLLMQIIKTAEGYGVGDQSSVLLECSAKIDEAVGYGAGIFKPIIELQKSRQEKRGYKYLYEIDGHKYSSSILLDNGDAALAEICRRIFEHNGEAGFYVNFTVRLDRIFDIKREYTEASVDGLYGTVAMCILTYSEGTEAFDAAFPLCKAFYEAYRQVWFSSDGCIKVIDAMNTTGLDPISKYTQLNYTLYMTEAEKEAFAEKIISANGDTELVKKSFSSMYYELSYFKNLRNLINASASDLDFSTLDLNGVDSIWFTPESPTARYKGKSFTKDGKDSQVFNELLQSTAALQLSPLSEIPERAYADVTTYRITLYRGEETVLTYRADTEANLFFIYSYINGSCSESVYTAKPGNLPPLIQAIEDAQKSYAE